MINKHNKTVFGLIITALLVVITAIPALAQTGTPLTDKELVSMLYQLPAHPEKRDEVIEAIRTRGLGFPLTNGLRSLVATKSGNDAQLRRTLEEAERRRLNPTAAALPPEAEAAELLEKTHTATDAAAQKMPDFLVKQQVTRSQALGKTNNWSVYDRLTIAVSYRASAGEQYKLLLVNGMQPDVETGERSDYSGKLTGTTSTGEYVSALAELFRPEARTQFKLVDTDLLRGRRTVVYEFVIKKEFSRSVLGWGENHARELETVVGQRGRVWVDREKNRVLRLENISTEIDPGFPISASSKVIDYDWVTINEAQYLLPSRAVIELTDRRRGQTIQTRNDILFKGYRKFGSELRILDVDDKDFIDDDEPGKTPVPPPKKP